MSKHVNENKKQPWSGRISTQTRERLESLRGQLNADHDELLTHLLDAMDMKLSNEVGLSAPILSGPRREVPKITKHLQASLDAMASAICLAELDASQTNNDAQAKIAEISESLQLEKEKNVMLAECLAEIKEDNRKLCEESEKKTINLKLAQERTESLDALKSSWKIREEQILDKVKNLEAIAAKAQDLENKLIEAVRSKEKTEMQLQSFDKEIQKMEAEINRLKAELKDTSSKYREIFESYSDEVAKNKILLSENARLENLTNKLQISMEEIENTHKTDKKTYHNAEQELATTKVRLEELANSNHRYKDELTIQANRFEQENLRTDRELEKLHVTIERQSQQIQQLILKLGQQDPIESIGNP